MQDFTFIPFMDHFGDDYKYVGNHRPIEELKNICLNDENILCFNTLGFMKNKINMDKLSKIFNNHKCGIYIHTQRYVTFLNNKKNNNNINNVDNNNKIIQLNGYEYIDDIYDIDASNIIEKHNNISLEELKILADKNIACIAFTTQGELKKNINKNNLIKINGSENNIGIYIKTSKIINIQSDPSSCFNYRMICINLKRRPDRKLQFYNNIKQFPDLNKQIDYYEAVDGKNLKSTSEIKNLFRNNDFNYMRGVVGCALSHFNLWEELINENYLNNYIIFEDDVIFNKNFYNQLGSIKCYINNNNLNFDIIWLGLHLDDDHKIKHNKISNNHDSNYLSLVDYNYSEFKSCHYICGAFAYIISKSCAKKLCDYAEKHGINHGIDYWITHKVAKELNLIQYEVYPYIVRSEWVSPQNNNIDSDIQKNKDCLKF